METETTKYDYIIKETKDTHFDVWGWEEERIKKNMKADIEWLDKNKHLLYNKDYLQTHILVSIGSWKYFTPLWRLLAYAILIGLALGAFAWGF